MTDCLVPWAKITLAFITRCLETVQYVLYMSLQCVVNIVYMSSPIRLRVKFNVFCIQWYYCSCLHTCCPTYICKTEMRFVLQNANNYGYPLRHISRFHAGHFAVVVTNARLCMQSMWLACYFCNNSRDTLHMMQRAWPWVN